MGLDRLRPRQQQMGHIVESRLAARGGGGCARQLRRRQMSDRALLLRQPLRRVRDLDKSWSLVQRDSVQHAKTAALDECGKAGKACRIIGSVCADGSGR